MELVGQSASFSLTRPYRLHANKKIRGVFRVTPSFKVDDLLTPAEDQLTEGKTVALERATDCIQRKLRFFFQFCHVRRVAIVGGRKHLNYNIRVRGL